MLTKSEIVSFFFFFLKNEYFYLSILTEEIILKIYVAASVLKCSSKFCKML